MLPPVLSGFIALPTLLQELRGRLINAVCFCECFYFDYCRFFHAFLSRRGFLCARSLWFLLLWNSKRVTSFFLAEERNHPMYFLLSWLRKDSMTACMTVDSQAGNSSGFYRPTLSDRLPCGSASTAKRACPFRQARLHNLQWSFSHHRLWGVVIAIALLKAIVYNLLDAYFCLV